MKSFLFILALLPVTAIGAGLKVGFYNKSCPTVESLVQQAVAAAFKNNSGIAAGLIRLHFHDCFVKNIGMALLQKKKKERLLAMVAVPLLVACADCTTVATGGDLDFQKSESLLTCYEEIVQVRLCLRVKLNGTVNATTCLNIAQGCDGSVLIDSTANNTAEKDSIPNFPSLRGFEVIDAAKKAVEAKCPRTVSCADILAFAARDSIALTGNNLTYKVPAGRRDGRVSTKKNAEDNLPSPLSNAAELVGNFTGKGLTAEDMVVLSGAHTVGRSHCSSFTNRLYQFSNASDVDPTISAAYASLLKSICPSNSNQTFPTTTTAMDLMTPAKLDNLYYVGLANNLGLFTSDQALLTNATLKASVDAFVKSENKWKSKFAKSMVKMGNIEVLTGTQGEIRLNCRVINSGSSSAGVELGMVNGSGGSDGFDEI
ncbi:hypothetical protein EJB05_30714, partial [Eragrostis curvula]